jgi:signal peptidase I
MNDPIGSSELLDIGSQLLDEAKELRLQVGGGSMFPYMRNGDIAHIVKCPLEELRPGHVVVYNGGHRWVAHRLMRISKNNDHWTLVTHGDSCLRPDPAFTEENYAGRIISVERKGASWRIDGKGHHRFGRIVIWAGTLIHPILHGLTIPKRFVNKLRIMNGRSTH